MGARHRPDERAVIPSGPNRDPTCAPGAAGAQPAEPMKFTNPP